MAEGEEPGPADESGVSRMALRDRFGHIAHTSTRSDLGIASCPASSRRTIEVVESFAEVYDMGKEVMPSTHKHMKVHFCKRRADGVEGVVKIRFKPRCFRGREDERHWRQHTEFLMNLPENCGIARLHDVMEDSKGFYVVMEKVSGLDLFETLMAEGRVSMHASRDILRHILAALVHMHAHNAVHKDLKLENIMLEHSLKMKRPLPESIRVIDFDTLEEWTPNTPIAKDVVGTDQYISQEAYSGRYSPLSDVFAVGVIAYRFFTGKFPFHRGMFDDEPGENWVGSPKMSQIRRRLKVARVDYTHRNFREHPLAADLVQRLLSSQEQYRPTAAAALEHPFFQEEIMPDAATSSRKPASQQQPPQRAQTTAGDEAWPPPSRGEKEELLDDGIIIADGLPF